MNDKCFSSKKTLKINKMLAWPFFKIEFVSKVRRGLNMSLSGKQFLLLM
jgi:hypothetical protein